MSQNRDERFRSALSGQSTPGVAAGVTGAEQRLIVGGTHDDVCCVPPTNKMMHTARRSDKCQEQPGMVLWGGWGFKKNDNFT